eukprot:TRINITY_DN15477_c0_g1_i2.p1 TRINITY_DN15477_c0_g1~~TRINITY_DN15477_c0_g1_i2.p1  ORF type:complete len:110 (+),score=17.74 TRINITY_DN15477_c0_g1_i2:241-570(+)
MSDCVRVLLSAGASPSAKNRLGQTPIHLADEGQHREIAAMLRKAVAPPPAAAPGQRAAAAAQEGGAGGASGAAGGGAPAATVPAGEEGGRRERSASVSFRPGNRNRRTM